MFAVGDLSEVAEKEPNNDVDQAQRVELNTTINGTIGNPTDVDYFAFAAKKGQRVTAEIEGMVAQQRGDVTEAVVADLQQPRQVDVPALGHRTASKRRAAA